MLAHGRDDGPPNLAFGVNVVAMVCAAGLGVVGQAKVSASFTMSIWLTAVVGGNRPSVSHQLSRKKCAQPDENRNEENENDIPS